MQDVFKYICTERESPTKILPSIDPLICNQLQLAAILELEGPLYMHPFGDQTNHSVVNILDYIF